MLSPDKTAFLICDVQVKFTPIIHQVDHVIATANKVLKLAKVALRLPIFDVSNSSHILKIFEIPVLVTEQIPAKLGPTVSAIDLHTLGPLHLGTFSKTLFSMVTSEVADALSRANVKSIILLGIESHICILQTALDLLGRGYNVYVLADGVSSANKEEIPLALASIRHAGAMVTTSESIAYQLLRDANHMNFRTFMNMMREEKDNATNALSALLGH